ncbi:MAG: hypothetical protein WBA53_00095 [Burkholderiaceae bacterium]
MNGSTGSGASASEARVGVTIAPADLSFAVGGLYGDGPQAGGRAEDNCRITASCCDKPAYLAVRAEFGEAWRRRMGTHYPAMSMIFVAEPLDSPALIELEATPGLPPAS